MAGKIEGELWRSEEPNFLYGIRCPYDDLRQFKYVELMPDQEAVLISRNGLLAHYESEHNEIDHNLIPAPPRLLGIPFGKTNPTQVELWIINIQRPGAAEWTIENLQALLLGYNKVIPLKIKIEYGVDIVNTKDFIHHYIGTGGGRANAISADDLHKDIFLSDSIRLHETILKFLENHVIMPSSGSLFLDKLSEKLSEKLEDRLGKRGLNLRYLDVESIEIDADRLGSMKRQLYLSGLGLNGTVLVARCRSDYSSDTDGTNTMAVSTKIDTTYRNARTSTSGKPGVVYCAQCAKKHLTTERFCPNCGNEYHPCPVCGADNLPAAKRCVKCGMPLKNPYQATTCQHCGEKILEGSAFCPHCGNGHSMAKTEMKTCSRCRSAVPASVKFCSACGARID